MKNDSQRKTLTIQNCTHAVSNHRPIKAAIALDRTTSSADDHRFTASQSQRVPARLRPRYLFNQQQFPALKLGPRFAQRNDHLKRENRLSVHILMQTIKVAFPIAQQQRCRPDLAMLPAML